MNILSLFDGMSCGQIALNRCGIKYDNYFASEVDKFAIKVTQANYPDTIQLGDVKNYQEWDLPEIDLMIGGSPCQGFSFAGRGLNFEDPRSKLFFKFVDCLKKIKPKKFLFENVRMKKEYQDIISAYLGCEPININSNLVSAQNRNRYYWTNIPVDGLPEDEGIYLRDIIETDVDEKYFVNLDIKGERSIKNLLDGLRCLEEKSRCLTASGQRSTNSGATTLIIQKERGFNSGGVKALGGKTPALTSNSFQHNNHLILKLSKKLKLKRDQNKAACLTGGAHSGGNHSDMDLIFIGGLEKGRRLYDEKNLSRNFREGSRIYSINGKACALTSCTKGGSGGFTGMYLDNYYIVRRLTPIECERLQTVPDNYTKIIDISTHLLYITQGINNKNEVITCKKNVELMGVTERLKQKNMGTSVLCITKELSDMEVLNYQKEFLNQKKSVSIVIEKLEKKVVVPEECVINTIKIGSGMEILYIQKKLEKNLDQEDIKKELMVRMSTGLIWRIILGESSINKKEFIISILIKLIIEMKIFSYVKDKANIQLYINNLKQLGENFLEVELSGLKMESITYCSNTQRYKMLGNGWTIDVICHILEGLKQ